LEEEKKVIEMGKRKNVCEVFGLDERECEYLSNAISCGIEEAEDLLEGAKREKDRDAVRVYRKTLRTWKSIERKLFP